jgi:hypothetical protein
MGLFKLNPTRFDPYKNFKFRLKFAGHPVAGLSTMCETALTPAFPHAWFFTRAPNGAHGLG